MRVCTERVAEICHEEEERCQPMCHEQGASACRRPQSPRLREVKATAWGLRAQIQPGLGLSLLLDVPTDHKAVTPYPCCPTKVLCQNGHSSWHLPVSLFFFPGALNVSTLILAHLSAEAPAYRPRHMFPQATQDSTK